MLFYYEEVDIIQVRREGQVLKFWGFETNKKRTPIYYSLRFILIVVVDLCTKIKKHLTQTDRYH